MRFENNYYENRAIWTKEILDYQKDILEEIIKHIPSDVESILDAGCGNGIICNNLDEKYDVTACDISETALSFVKTPKKYVASIDRLPFSDNSFDLVMVNDVLEHLDIDTFKMAINEIRRVAKKYILISSPFMENLKFNYTRCIKCGNEFHTNLHKRSFELKDFLNLFEGFSVGLAIFAGEIYQSTITPFVKYRHLSGEYISDTDTICPFCGTENKRLVEKNPTFGMRINDILEYSFFLNNSGVWRSRPDRQEVLFLYVKNNHSYQPNNIYRVEELSNNSINELKFTPIFLMPELKPFYPYPQFQILSGRYNFENDFLRVEGEDVEIRFSLPISISAESQITINFEVKSQAELVLMVYDSVCNKYRLIKRIEQENKSADINIFISDKILPSRYGALFQINIKGSLLLKSFKLKCDNQKQNFSIINVDKGYLSKEIEGIPFLYRTNSNKLIKPEWFFSLSKDFSLSSFFGDFNDSSYIKGLNDILNQINGIVDKQLKEINDLQLLAERIERDRSKAEEEYQKTLREIKQLKQLLEDKENERQRAEDIAEKYLNDIKILERRIVELNDNVEEIEKRRAVAEDSYSKALQEIKVLNEKLEEKELLRAKAEEVAQKYLREIKALEDGYNDLNERLNKTEEKRSAAERMYQEALREVNQLKQLLENKENERQRAEDIAEKYLNDIKILEKRIIELNDKVEEIEKRRVVAEDSYSKALQEIKVLNEKLEEKELLRAKAEEVAAKFFEDIKSLENRYNDLYEKLNENEKLRQRVEESYIKLLDEYNQLKSRFDSYVGELTDKSAELNKMREESKELMELNERLRFEKDEIEKEKERALKTLEIIKSKKVRRVLVLSHMFPHKDQPVFGPFVLDQVKAILRYSDIDVRVISCRPFWMSSFNPFRLKEANRIYWEEIKKVKWEEKDGVKVMYPPYRVGGPFRFVTHWHTYSQAILSVIYDVWKEFKFDLIHAHTAYIDGSAAKAVFEKLRIPYIITEHMAPYSAYVKNPIVLHKSIESSRFANRILCVSPDALEEVKRYMPEDVRNKMLVMPNTIDISEFYPSKFKKRQNNEYKLLFIGTLEERKNPELLLRVLIRLLKVGYNLKLSIIGRGVLREKILNFISSNNIEDSVEVIDGLPHDQIPELLRDKDIFVLPSRSETFGVVVAEALACGKPVVVTRCGGPEYIVNDEGLGRLVDVDDEDEFFDAIVDVINNYESFDPIWMHNNIKERFGFENFANKLSEIYEEVVS